LIEIFFKRLKRIFGFINFIFHILADLKKDDKIEKPTINATKKNEGIEFSLYSKNGKN
jgi:hypothetical protein